MKNLVVILAGGRGSRMGDTLPKALVKLDDVALIDYVIANVKPIINDICIVYSKYSELLTSTYDYKFARQLEPLGSGDALKSAMSIIKDYDNVMVLSCDMPLISTNSYKALYDKYFEGNNAVYMTTILNNPVDYGRIVRNGNVIEVVEQPDTDDTNKNIKEVNVASYMFNVKALEKYVYTLDNKNKKQEYYITDLIKIMSSNGLKCDTCMVLDAEEFIGVNSKKDLEIAKQILSKKRK